MPASLADLRRESSLTTEAEPAPTWAVWIMRAAAVAGTALSAYLAWAAITTASVAGCGANVFNCDTVLTSRWSTWLHVPVSFVGVSLYLSLLVALSFAGNSMPAALRRASAALVLGLATAAAGAAVWFLGVMLLDVKHICPWCVGVHLCSITIAVLAWKHLGPTAENLRPLGTLGFLAVGALVIGQLAMAPTAKFQVTHSGAMTDKPVLVLGDKKGKPTAPGDAEKKPAASKTNAPANVPKETTKTETAAEKPAVVKGPAPETGSPPKKTAAPESSDLIVDAQPSNTVTALKPATEPPVESSSPAVSPPNLPPAPVASAPESATKERIITALSGKVRLNVYDQPHVGNPEAPYVVVKLFDYTCHHCRQMHQLLHAAEERYGDQFAVVLLPVPMNGACNRFVRETPAAHRDGCALALYALAVYRLNPAAFVEFDQWLYEPEAARTEPAARAKVIELVGEERLKKLLDGGELDRQLRENVEVYGLCGAGPIPKLLFRQITEKGRMDRPEELFDLLEKEFPEMKPRK